MSISALELKRNKLMTDAQGLLSTETVSIESRASAKLMLAEVDTIESDIADLRRIESHNAAQAEFVRSARPNATGGVEGDKTPEQRKKEFNGAFRQFARHGYASLNQEQRDLVTTSDTTGGALIPQAFEGVLHNALKYYGPTAQKVAQKVTDNKGIPMKISFGNDTANGLVLLGTEGTSSPAETDPAFRSAILGVDTVTGGLVKVSFQELEDSSFDLDSWLRTAFSVRYARGMEKAVTLGTDNAGTTLPSQGTGGLVGAATVGDVTASIAAGLGWADFSKAYATLDPAYINSNSTWVMSSTTRGFLVGLVDGFGRPFFTPDPSGANPFQQILGFDITINQAMPAYNTANAKSVLFGDLSQAYMLRTDGQPSVLRLNER
jgi:HK97 family phage major capsid protein